MLSDGRIQNLAPFWMRWQLGEAALEFHRNQAGVHSPRCCSQQRFMSNTHGINQAQRACVMQPRVRRTLGIESSYVFISPNPNGVSSDSTTIYSRASKVAISLREMSQAHGKLTSSRTSTVVHGGESHSRISTERDGYFASPDRRGHAFNNAVNTPKSAGGPAHSRTLPRAIEPTFL